MDGHTDTWTQDTWTNRHIDKHGKRTQTHNTETNGHTDTRTHIHTDRRQL